MGTRVLGVAIAAALAVPIAIVGQAPAPTATPSARVTEVRTTFKAPKTPWGQPAMGHRTRRNKLTGQFIVRSRHRKS